MLYNIIYADPPWEYKRKGSKNAKGGMAATHYKTMCTKEIKQLPVQQYCAPEAICFLWATFPNIKEALEVMESWGFIYKTAAFVWVKTNKDNISFSWGMGAYTRANAEICLLGVTPKVKVEKFILKHNIHQIVKSPRLKHSKKPDEVRDRIVELCGNLPRIELFARQKTEGWDVWGNEVESDMELINSLTKEKGEKEK